MSKVGKWYGLKLGKMASQNPCVYADSKNLLILLTKYTHCCEAEPAEPFFSRLRLQAVKIFSILATTLGNIE